MGVRAMEDRWQDGRLLTCPRVSVHAAALPIQTDGATGEIESGHPRHTAGEWDPQHSELPHTRAR